MKVSIAIISCFVCFATNVETKSSFIVNGENVPENRPYYAYVEMFRLPGFQGDAFFGGGTLISVRAVLTVAQNVAGFQSWRIGLGGIRIADLTFFNVATAHVHGQYNNVTLANNIAVIRLTVDVTISANIQPIGRVIQGSPFPLGGHAGYVIGFGFGSTNVQPNILQQARLTVLNQPDCGLAYPHLIATGQLANHFCAQNTTVGSNICVGDQGGPIVSPDINLLFGIQSFNRVADCASPESQPAGFIRVSQYQDFINQHL